MSGQFSQNSIKHKKKRTGEGEDPPFPTKAASIDSEDSQQLRTDDSMLDELLDDLDQIPGKDSGGEEEQKEVKGIAIKIAPLPLASPRTESLLLTPGGKAVREDTGLSPLSPARKSSGQDKATTRNNASTIKTEDQAIQNTASMPMPMSQQPGAVVAVAGRQTSRPDDSVMELKSNFPDSLPAFDKNSPSPIALGKKSAAAPAPAPSSRFPPPAGKPIIMIASPKSPAGKNTLSPPLLLPGKATTPMSPVLGRPGAIAATDRKTSGPEMMTEDSGASVTSSSVLSPSSTTGKAKRTSPAPVRPGAIAVTGRKTSAPEMMTEDSGASVTSSSVLSPSTTGKARRTSPAPVRPGAIAVTGRKTGGPEMMTEDSGASVTSSSVLSSSSTTGKAKRTSPAPVRPGAIAVPGRKTSGPEIINAEVEPRPKPSISYSDQAAKRKKTPPALAPGAWAVSGGGDGDVEEARSSTKFATATATTGPSYVEENDDAPNSSVSDRDRAAKQSAKGSSSSSAVKPGAVAVKPGGREESTTSSNISGSQLSYIDSEMAERSEDTSSTAARDREAKRSTKGAAAAVKPGAVAVNSSEKQEASQGKAGSVPVPGPDGGPSNYFTARDRAAKRNANRESGKPGAVAVKSNGKKEALDSTSGKPAILPAYIDGDVEQALSSSVRGTSASVPGDVAIRASGKEEIDTATGKLIIQLPEYIDDEVIGPRRPSLKLGAMGARSSDNSEDLETHNKETTLAFNKTGISKTGGTTDAKGSGRAARRADKPGVVAVTGSALAGTKFAAASTGATSTASATSAGGSVGSSAVSQTKDAGSLKMALSADSILDGPLYYADEMEEEEDDTVADTTADTRDISGDQTPSESIAAFSWSSIVSDPEDGGDDVDAGSPTLRTSNSNRPLGARALSAELVTAEAYNEEDERERIRKEAEKDAQQRLLDGAITATAEVIPDDKEIEQGLNKKLYGAIACVVVIAIIVIASVLATRPDEKPPTPGPSFNNICETAFSANAIDDVITGTISPRSGTDNVTCQTAETDTGFGLWYSLQGNGERLRASTCNGTEFDTQVLVLTGTCETLLCVGGSDQMCGEQSSVGWLAEEDTEYFILVRGYRASNDGNFVLTVESLVDNGNCDDAFQIEEGGIPLIGSTRNLITEDSIETCSSAAAAETEAWHRLGGDGNIQCASVFTEDGSAQLSIFAGDSCSDLTCVGGLENLSAEETGIMIEFTWITEAGAPYFLVVHGSDVEQAGDFLLDVRSPPANNLCTTAFDVPADGSIQTGTTIDACRGGTNQCGSKNVDAAGVWYSVQGTGNWMVASTCNTNSDFELQTLVLTGSCGDLECVDFDKEACGDQSSVSWLSDRGTVYLLLVQGIFPGTNGNFELTVEELFSDVCETALPFAVNGEAIVGSTTNATLDDAGICANTTSPGVWYVINGTGTNLTASACNPETNFSADLTVFTGGCSNLECVEAIVLSCDGRSSIAFWPSIAGQEYFILVHGIAESNETTTGTFALTIEEGGRGEENDFCSTANQLSLPSSVVGSTMDATTGAVDQCGLTGTTAPGVWYTVVGTGTSVTASLCSDGTNFDTRMFVYEGSCGALLCVVADDDFCNRESSATWDAADGLEYFILVGGFGSAVGNFELTVTPG
jgi:hypothetical protein